MDLTPLDLLDMVQLFFHEHPELCPHKMEWVTSSENLTTHIKEVKYRCAVCGKEKTVIMNQEDEM